MQPWHTWGLGQQGSGFYNAQFSARKMTHGLLPHVRMGFGCIGPDQHVILGENRVQFDHTEGSDILQIYWSRWLGMTPGASTGWTMRRVGLLNNLEQVASP